MHLSSPAKKSTPGNCYSLRIGLKNNIMETTSEVLDTIKIFLHLAGKFLYFREQDRMPDNFKIDLLSLRKDHAHVITLRKTSFTSLSRPQDDRECVDDNSYDWKSCLDNMFYKRKGCQDPWYVNQGTKIASPSIRKS